MGADEMECKISPIFYMGNKKKLIQKGLIDLFPKDINIFLDLFAGSGVVSMNVIANNYVINDIDVNLYSLYNLFKTKNSKEIINHIDMRINEFGLAKERTKRNMYFDKEKIEEYKQAYSKLRILYNKEKNILDFYTLMFYSFSQQFRFNNKGEFNMPCGNDCFSETNKTYIQNGCDFFSNKNVKLVNKNFTELKVEKLKSNDFVYIDSPYLGTTATYNENGGWNVDNENELYSLCEKLNSIGVSFGMSNVFENKGITNSKLIKWCEDNNWNVFSFNNFSYCACGKGNSGAKEVYITNYKTGVDKK